jgi:cell volume regulation protein A
MASPDPHLLGDFLVSGEITVGDIAQIYGISVDPAAAQLTLADYFDVNLDRAPKVGATLPLDAIVLVARNISEGRVNVVGLRLPEDEEKPPSLTRKEALRQKASKAWSSIARF